MINGRDLNSLPAPEVFCLFAFDSYYSSPSYSMYHIMILGHTIMLIPPPSFVPSGTLYFHRIRIQTIRQYEFNFSLDPVRFMSLYFLFFFINTLFSIIFVYYYIISSGFYFSTIRFVWNCFQLPVQYISITVL